MNSLNKLWRDSGYITDPGRLFDFQFGGGRDAAEQKYTLDEIEDYIHKQRAYQLFRKKPSKLSGHITAFEINDVMQMDLLDFQKLKTRNKGYSWILNLIDVFSRKLYTRPLKNKTMGSVKEALTAILHQRNEWLQPPTHGSHTALARFTRCKPAYLPEKPGFRPKRLFCLYNPVEPLRNTCKKGVLATPWLGGG